MKPTLSLFVSLVIRSVKDFVCHCWLVQQCEPGGKRSLLDKPAVAPSRRASASQALNCSVRRARGACAVAIVVVVFCLGAARGEDAKRTEARLQETVKYLASD